MQLQYAMRILTSRRFCSRPARPLQENISKEHKWILLNLKVITQTTVDTAEAIECIHILPTHTHVATSEKMMGSNIRVIRIYSMKGNEKTQTIKIFH